MGIDIFSFRFGIIVCEGAVRASKNIFIISLKTCVKNDVSCSGVLRSGSIKACVKTKGGGLSSTVFKIMK